MIIISLFTVGAYTYYNNTNNPTIVESEKQYYDAVENGRYIQITTEKIYDLGIVKKTTRRKLGIKIKETKTYYMGIDLDGKLLTITLSSDEYEKIVKQQTGPYLIRGKLKKYNSKDLTYIKNTLIEEGYSLEEVDLFLCLNYLEYMTPFLSAWGYIFIAILIMIVLLFIFIPNMRKNTSAFKSLKRYSNGEFEKTLHQIDNEIQLSDVYKNKPLTITQNYIIVENHQFVLALPIKELMWVYKIIEKGKNGRKYYCLVLVFSDRGKYKIQFFRNLKGIDDAIQYISEHSTRIIIGSSDELQKLFKKNPNGFILKWEMSKDDEEINLSNL